MAQRNHDTQEEASTKPGGGESLAPLPDVRLQEPPVKHAGVSRPAAGRAWVANIAAASDGSMRGKVCMPWQRLFKVRA